MRRLLLGAVLLILACEGAATLPAPSQTSPSAIPTIDVSDMMGAFPQTQLLVMDGDSVKSLALLNHSTRYTIATSGRVFVAAGNAQVYIADEAGNGTRLRWIDKVTGGILATRIEPDRKLASTTTAHGALAVESTTGRLLAMFADGARRVVDAFEPYSFLPLGRHMESSCGDRLLTGAGRVVVACFAGTLAVRDGGGDQFVIDAGLGPLVAAAVRGDGTTLVGRKDGTLVQIRPASRDVERIEPFRSAELVADGIAPIDPESFAIALSTTDRSVGVSELRLGRRYVSFPAKNVPLGGLLAMDQFAYWADGNSVKHIDLQQGFAETMATLVGSVLPGAVSGY
jgi:hypothetical protein